MSNNGNGAMLGPKQVAAILGVTVRTVQRLIKQRKIAVFRYGPRIVRVHPEDLAVFIQSAAVPQIAPNRPVGVTPQSSTTNLAPTGLSSNGEPHHE